MALFKTGKRSRQARPISPMPPSWYDEKYYQGKNGKSNWSDEYTWENFEEIFRAWAKTIFEIFPETRSFLDAGCGKGFLVKALLRVAVLNDWNGREAFGFDHSEYAIAAADDDLKPLLTCAGLDDFEFERDYEVLLSFDVFEHCDEAQVRRFLARSRPHIMDCFCGVIALDTPKQRLEPSHVLLKNRQWWNDLFVSCGWIFDREMELMTAFAREELNNSKEVEIFFFKSGNHHGAY